ncbi:response regulator [Pseudoalteromonas ulvae]|uniref:response regulator n=1 Tax=Pseudoalteromonas ulvae TaxID=107327 RepID=UPI00186B652D|nr:response regulator [Pseudoalteromonas ulvae]
MIKCIWTVLVAVLFCCCMTTAYAQNSSPFTAKISEISALPDDKAQIKALDLFLSQTELSPLEKITVYFEISRIYYQNGQYQQTITQLNNALEVAKTHDLKLEQASAYNRLGVIHYLMGNNPSALLAYQYAEQLFVEIDEPLMRAKTYNNLGLVNAAMGSVEQALKYYQLAQPIYNELGSETDKVDILFNIAGLHLRLKQNDYAIKMLEQVITRRQALNDLVGLALGYGDLGAAYKNDGQFQLSEQYLQKSLQYYLDTGDAYNSASQYHNLAELYSLTGEIAKANEYATLAAQVAEQSSNKAAYAGSLYTQAKLAFIAKNFELALDFLHQSSEVSSEMMYRDQLKENLTLHALISASQLQPIKALRALQSYKDQVKDESDKQLQDKLTQYQALLDSEQLSQQVKQLKQTNRIDALSLAQTRTERNFTIVVAILLLVSTFLLFRRAISENAKLQLSEKVKQRSEELEEISKKLQRASEVKSQFLANMSHEIRTPLTAVMGQAELIINGDISADKVRDEVQVIYTNSLHLLELINDILDLTRIEANKLTLDKMPHNVVSLVSDVMQMFDEPARSKGLKLELIHHLPSPFYIEMDKFRLKQILINLCSNAVKFTDQGSVSLTVSETKFGLKFCIADTGIGMTQEQLGNIFNSFTQGDNTISRRFGGSGLGLCLSEQLANLMNSSISVDSELGHGSQFTLHLTCDQLFDYQEELSPAPLETVPQTLFEGVVLVAEDHEDNRRLISLMLEKLGFTVLCAENGKQAVEIALKTDIDIILLDIQMPEMDGIAAFKLLKECGCNTPIIALTANAMAHEVKQYYELGFNDHLKKPIERKLFIETLAKHLAQKELMEKAPELLEQIDMSDLIERFQSSFQQEALDLALAYSQGDFNQLGQQAHKIAGAAAMFQFEQLASAARYLEQVIKYEDFDEVAEAVESVKQYLTMEVQV